MLRIIYFKIFLLITSVFLLAGCNTFNENLIGAEHARTDFFETKKAKFSIAIVEGQVKSHYDILLIVNPKLDRDLFLQIEFENPADRNRPIAGEKIVFPRDDFVSIQSPIIEGREPNQEYRVDIRIFDNNDRSISYGVHRQYVRSYTDDMSL